MRRLVQSCMTRWLGVAVSVAILAACADSSTPVTTRTTSPETSTTAVPGELGLVVSPEFVQGSSPASG